MIQNFIYLFFAWYIIFCTIIYFYYCGVQVNYTSRTSNNFLKLNSNLIREDNPYLRVVGEIDPTHVYRETQKAFKI